MLKHIWKEGAALQGPRIKCTDKAGVFCPLFDEWDGGLGSKWRGSQLCHKKNVYLKLQKRFEEKIYLRGYKLNEDTKTLIGKMYKLFQKLNEGKRSKKKKKKKMMTCLLRNKMSNSFVGCWFSIWLSFRESQVSHPSSAAVKLTSLSYQYWFLHVPTCCIFAINLFAFCNLALSTWGC